MQASRPELHSLRNRRMRDPARRAGALALAAAGAAAALPANADAQLCPQVRGKEGKSLKIALARSQPDCLNPTTTTSGGIPACPGVQPTGQAVWNVGPKTKVDLRLQSGKNGDVALKLTGGGILNQGDQPADGVGTLRLRTRLVVQDPQNGPMTTVPFDLTVPVPVTNGKVKLATSLGTMLANAGLGALPPCFRGDFTQIVLENPLGAAFTDGAEPLFSERSGVSFGAKG
jgi:hypothetical protein